MARLTSPIMSRVSAVARSAIQALGRDGGALRIRFAPTDFIQINAAVNLALVELALDLLELASEEDDEAEQSGPDEAGVAERGDEGDLARTHGLDREVVAAEDEQRGSDDQPREIACHGLPLHTR